MSGTKQGGILAATKVRATFGPDHYKRIGSLGGSKSRTGGFYGRQEFASIAGKLGGSISRRYRKDGTRVYVNPTEVARKRKEYEKAYQHLLKVNTQANR